MWAFAVGNMGLADEFFWNLTPLLFGKLADQYHQREHRKDLRAGLIAAELKNTLRIKDTQKVWVASDFFPEPQTKEETQTEAEMLKAMEAWVTRTKGRKRA